MARAADERASRDIFKARWVGSLLKRHVINFLIFFSHLSRRLTKQFLVLCRNKDIQNLITIDLHGQHVKQAMRVLKMHLLVVSYVQSKDYKIDFSPPPFPQPFAMSVFSWLLIIYFSLLQRFRP